MLRMLLLRRLGREADEKVCLGRLEEIWEHMSDEGRVAASAWVAWLPEELRAEGPQVSDSWDRASGDVFCSACKLTYRDHPVDPREPFPLVVACDGSRWKL